MLNRVVLVGRLTKDPEYRTTPSGVSVATFTLAVNRTFTNAQGEREADFINCVVFRRQADNVNNYLSKGSLAGVDGRLQSRNYENQEGRRVFVTEVVCDSVQFLEPKNAQQNGGQRQQNEFQVTVKDSVVNNQDKTIRTIIHQTRNNLIIHLQMQTDRLI
ncbi:single-strand DNA-binding protein [Staphylococcus aureus]|nr:single-strand DNA-binding protein [Staphylococcus aureus]